MERCNECLKAGQRPESNHPLKTNGIEGKLANHVPTNGAPISGTIHAPIETAYGNLTSHCGNSGVGLMANTGATVSPVSEAVLSALTCHAINPGMPSVATEVANAGSKLGSHVPINGAPFFGTMHAPVSQSQTAFGCLTSHCGNSDVGLIANAGAPSAPVTQTMKLTNHSENFGAIAAPVSQTMFGSLASPGINPTRMPSMANAGKWASHVPNPGASFLGTMGAPLSHAVFGRLTSHGENSDIALMAKAGATVAADSQTTNLTSHTGDSGALVAPVSQNMFGTLTGPAETAGMPLVANAGQQASLGLIPGAPYSVAMFDAPVLATVVGCLTSTAKNSGLSLMSDNAGIPVAPAVQTSNSASHAENSGINKCLDKEGSNTESAHQRLDPRKNPREPLTILDEQDLHLKKTSDGWRFWRRKSVTAH